MRAAGGGEYSGQACGTKTVAELQRGMCGMDLRGLSNGGGVRGEELRQW